MRSLGCLLLLLGAGCTAYATPAYVETTSAPYGDYRYYPSTVYEGRTVYYVDDRWMYPDRGRWYTYRVEPTPLYQYRQRPYVQSAPPAPPRAYPYPYQPPAPSPYPYPPRPRY